MTYEEELEKAKQRYRESLLASGIGQAGEQLGAAIAGVDTPSPKFYQGLEKQAATDYALEKEKAKNNIKYDPNSPLSMLARKKAHLGGMEVGESMSLEGTVYLGNNLSSNKHNPTFCLLSGF